jgi:hypothetical protein
LKLPRLDHYAEEAMNHCVKGESQRNGCTVDLKNIQCSLEEEKKSDPERQGESRLQEELTSSLIGTKWENMWRFSSRGILKKS